MKFFITTCIVSLIIHSAYCQQPQAIKLPDLEKRINSTSDTTYIVNFWATWCVPCVKELPAFDSITTNYNDKKVRVLLVNLNFKEELETKLIPFIADKKIKSEIVLLDETNTNYVIPKISSEWSGAIPATLIKNNQKQTTLFFEKKLNYNFLKSEIEKLQ